MLILKRRAESAEGDQERRQLLFKEARLSDDKLGDLPGAITVYEQILDMGLDPEAIGALERLYARGERWGDLEALYERQIDAVETTSERRAALHHALGQTLEQRSHDFDRAFEEYAAALSIDPKHPQTVALARGAFMQAGERNLGAARGRDARAGVPRAPRLAPRDDHAPGAARRRAKTPTSAGSSCGGSHEDARGAGGELTARRSR